MKTGESDDTGDQQPNQQQQQLNLRRSTRKRSAPVRYDQELLKKKEVVFINLADTRWHNLNVLCIRPIAQRLSTEDCFRLASAYPQSAISQEVLTSPSGVLATQKALNLLLDSYAHSRQVRADQWEPMAMMLAQAPLKDFQGNEAMFTVGRDRVRQIGLANLKAVLPGVTTLRLLIRRATDEWLDDAIQVLQMYSGQLVSLQIIFWSRGVSDLAGKYALTSYFMEDLLLLLNKEGQFPALTHLTFAMDGHLLSKCAIFSPPNLVNLLDHLSECFIYLPKSWVNTFLEAHSAVMQANQGLTKFGFTTYEDTYENWSTLESCSPQIAAKICFMHPSLCRLSQYPQMATRMHLFTSLTRFKFEARVTATSNLYAQVLANLQGMPKLSTLSIILHYHEHPRFAQDDFQLIRLPSVEALELTIQVNADAPPDEGKAINHDILAILAVRQQFQGLKSLKLCVDGKCSICRKRFHFYVTQCYAKLVEPVKHFCQLEAFNITFNVPYEPRF